MTRKSEWSGSERDDEWNQLGWDNPEAAPYSAEAWSDDAWLAEIWTEGGWDEPDDWPAYGNERFTPSLSIILFSAAGGVAGGILALYISLRWFNLGIELSAGIATLGMLFSLGISGAVLTAATGSRATPVNLIFSCGVILLVALFMAICVLFGAIIATLLATL